MIRDLVQKNRSYRRFYQEKEVPLSVLKELLSLTRFCASASNRQPLKYILTHSPENNNLVFPCLSWAGYLTDWPGPEEGERPSAYIVILLDKSISENPWVDHGIAAQTMLLAATEKGYGGCIFGAIDKTKLKSNLALADHLEILLVVALGWPKEKVVIEDLGLGGSIKYYRDSESVHHVPKRKTEDVILGLE